MPPLVTLTPSPLDAVNANSSPNSCQAGLGVGGPDGPWFITGGLTGNNWYALACDNRGGRTPSGQDTPQIYKSTDDRATWAKVAEMGNQYNLWSSYYPGTGTIIYMVVTDHNDTGLPPRLVAFDAASETFGAVSTAHPTVTFQGKTTGLVLAVQSDGTQWLIFDFNSGGEHIEQISWNAGVWSAAGSIFTSGGLAPNPVPMSLVMESDQGRFHFWFFETTATTVDVYYCQCPVGGPISGPALIHSFNFSSDGQIFNGTHLSCISGTKLFFPFAFVDISDGLTKPAVLVGTGLASPTWQYILVDPSGSTVGDPNYVGRDTVAISGAVATAMVSTIFNNPTVFYRTNYVIYTTAVLPDSGVVVFWDVVPTSGATLYAGRIYYAVWDGISAFGAPVLFFDSGVTPFPNETTTSANDMFFMSFGSSSGVVPPPVFAILCPVGGGSGTVGVPYSHQIVVSGGTPPFSNFHVISGALPPGLVMDLATGLIHGTPTLAGTYVFTTEATDSTDQTARVTCSIVIGVVPTGGFCFKLLKVIATLVPARHLPTRGSVQ